MESVTVTVLSGCISAFSRERDIYKKRDGASYMLQQTKSEERAMVS